VGLFAFDCVAFICGGQLSTLSRIIYALVGIAGLWCITLVGIPFGLQFFKVAKLSLAPFGAKIV